MLVEGTFPSGAAPRSARLTAAILENDIDTKVTFQPAITAQSFFQCEKDKVEPIDFGNEY